MLFRLGCRYEKGWRRDLSFFGKERKKMPKLILFAAALFSKPPRPRAPGAHISHTELTRSRVATRRQRASRTHDPLFDLSPLDLTRRR